MTQPVEVYDSDILAIDRIMECLAKRYQGSYRNYLAFEREATDLFGEIGLRITINWRGFMINGVPQEGAMPEITPVERLTPFDPDRMVYEVTQNILDLPGQEPGEVIKTDQGGTFKAFREVGGLHKHSGGSAPHHHDHPH